MRMAMMLALGLVAHAGVARAEDVSGDVEEMIEGLPRRETKVGAPAFSFTNDDAFWAGKDQFGNQPNFWGSGVDIQKLVTATSSDGKAAWFAAEVKGVPRDGDCAPEPCKPNRDAPLHVTGLIERAGKEWHWVTWHVAAPVGRTRQSSTAKANTQPDVLPRATKGADDVAKLVEAALADPAALAGLVADRKDVVLYGSEGPERWVGGAKVKAQLAAWKLAFTVRDGVQAGVVGGTVAWFAANVDARSAKRPTSAPAPYRVTAVLEKTGTAWKLVQLHFSVDTFTYQK